MNRVSREAGKKVIVIGIDGMDPRSVRAMMADGQLPNLARLPAAGGFSNLGTSIPPQSPVAWANFINGAGPGSHGIFDFIHRHPHEQCKPFYSAAETLPGEGGWEVGDHDCSSISGRSTTSRPPRCCAGRACRSGITSTPPACRPTFYDLPSNYPPSPSQHGHHRCICGMGTPDMLGTYGTYQYFGEDGPTDGLDEGGGKRSKLSFEARRRRRRSSGRRTILLKTPAPVAIEILVHRDREANAAVIEIQGQKLSAAAPGSGAGGRSSTSRFRMPWFVPNQHVSGICRFYLAGSVAELSGSTSRQSTSTRPLRRCKSRSRHAFVQDVVEDTRACSTPPAFRRITRPAPTASSTTTSTSGRPAWCSRSGWRCSNTPSTTTTTACCSSTSPAAICSRTCSGGIPTRSIRPVRPPEAQKYFGHIQRLYQKLDEVIGDIIDRYGSQATIIVMSDHGFANFGRQFNLNSWLRDLGYLNPGECTSIMHDVDWSRTTAYGLGINGLYLNLKGRERDGIVEPGEKQEALLTELTARLEAVTRFDGKPVIRGVYRADQMYSGNATALAPDLIVGYARGYRARGRRAWATDRRRAARQRLGLERRPLRRRAGGARRAVLQPPTPAGPIRRWSTLPHRSWPNSDCRRRRR